MTKRQRRAQREKEERWKKRELTDANGERDSQPGPGRKIYNGLSDLTPYNASRVIRGGDVDPDDVIVYGGKKYCGIGKF